MEKHLRIEFEGPGKENYITLTCRTDGDDLSLSINGEKDCAFWISDFKTAIDAIVYFKKDNSS